ncbi:hypothetical protein CCMSSC00406_0007971 [Pleurotus cornucopiae]|uniref:Uncharacterized protein n=1 Tax=Pleurotus cornucopiae TaxID=5321 RepID=A0ACB7ILN0_PLECO|nr:hypothetical protein CCMSSC00406_0007971 [Pleurotus cornucopiae]
MASKSKVPAKPPVIANGMSLRGNRSENVGGPDRKRLRRANGEAAAEKAEKARMKVSIDKTRKQSLRKVAVVQQAAKLADKENHHHPSLPARSKVPRAEELVPGSDDDCEREKEEMIQKNAEKKAKKRLTRRLIEGEIAIMDTGNAPVKIKRKADNAAIAEFSAKKVKTGKKPLGGLRADWSIKDNVPLQALHPHVNNQDSDHEPMGGISDDDNSISGERAALDVDPTGFRFKSLAKVNLTPVVPTQQLSAKRQQTLLRKKKITRNDVPDGIRREFYDKYIPYAIHLAGKKDAWYNPTYSDAYQSWVAVLVQGENGFGQPSSDHISVAETLINNTLSQIRNRTKEAAVKALDILLSEEKKTTIEEKKNYVKWLQGGGLYDAAPPFYFKIFNAATNKRKGPFQSFLIAFTFSLHMAAISGVPANHIGDDDSSPVVKQPGALVMAIQAVKRALFYYRSGVKEEPNPRDTLSHFSHSNWADHNEISIDKYGESITKLIPTTTCIQNLVKQLTERQWTMVNQEAVQFTLKETAPPSPPTSGSYDENPKLIDDDSDEDEDDAQPQQGPAPCEDDFDGLQPSTDEPIDEGPDDLLDFAANTNMRYQSLPTDNEEDESVTESDNSGIPGAAQSQAGIKWVRWDGDESDSAVGSDSIHDFESDFDELEEHE